MRHRFWFFFWGGRRFFTGNVDLDVSKLTDVLRGQPDWIFPFHIPSVNPFFDVVYRFVIDEHMIRFRIFFYGGNAFYRMKDGGTDRSIIGSDPDLDCVVIGESGFIKLKYFHSQEYCKRFSALLAQKTLFYFAY